MNEDSEHPYSEAFSARGLVFASGALSVDDAGSPVDGRREALDAALNNMSRRLATQGATLRDVVKVTYFVTDLTLRSEANEQFTYAFSVPRPARTFVEVSALPYGATAELDAIAIRRDV